MSQYSDEEKRESIRRAYELLDSLADLPSVEDLAAHEHELDDFPALDPVAKWRRDHEEFKRQRAQYREREMADSNEQRTRDWERWLAGHLENERKLILEAAGRAVGQIRHELREQLRSEFRSEVAELRNELANAKARGDETVKELRQELTIAKALGDGSIIDISPTSSSVVRKTKSTSSDAA